MKELISPVVLVVTGASGAGKTTLVRALAGREFSGVRCYYFDSIGVPSAELMERFTARAIEKAPFLNSPLGIIRGFE